MKRTSVIGFVTIVMLAALALVAAAGPAVGAPAAMPDSPSATLFSYQGQVSDAAGNPITNPALPMTFKLYTVTTGGTPCWTEAHTGGNVVAVTKGLFNVLLGQLTAIPSACLTGNAYLELVVNSETLSPRELLTSVAFAVEANTLTAGATTRGDATIAGHLTASGGATFGPMAPGPYEGGEINLAAGTSGNQWRLDNYYGTLRFHHDGNVYFSMGPSGNTWVGGNLAVNSAVTADRYRGNNNLALDNYSIVQPSSNVYLSSPGNDRDSWVFLDSAAPNANWGIYHRQIDVPVGDLPANSIGFIGGGTSMANAYIGLVNGDAFFRGNVGVGTASPSNKLEVYGRVAVGQPGVDEGGEIYLQPGASGTGSPNGWNIDNYFGTYL